jgi:peroxisomal 3,2-trans-enoyl-CoA isomerase
MSFKTVTLAASSTAGVAVLTLSRKSKKNAISKAMYLEIQAALLAAQHDDSTKALVLTGAGDYYSSGNDLSNFAVMQHPQEMAKVSKAMCYEFVDSFISFNKPLVAAVNGPAIGIPVTTLGLCDVRIAVPTATFHTPFKALAQAPEGCSSFMFPRIMGKDVAHEMLDGGRILSAAEAKACNFVSEIVERPELLPRAEALGAELAAEGAERFWAAEAGLDQQLRIVNQREVDVLEKAWVSHDCFDALAKYLGSRGKTGPALLFRGLNATRGLWERK